MAVGGAVSECMCVCVCTCVRACLGMNHHVT